MSARFEDILEESLRRVLDEGADIEQCLAAFPEEAERLRPLLSNALLVRMTAQKAGPSQAFRAELKGKLMSGAIPQMRRRHWGGILPFSLPRRWAIACASAMVLLLAGGSVVVASGSSLPEQPLYPVKTATERVRVVLTPSQAGKAELHAAFARERMKEIAAMAKKAKAVGIPVSLKKLRENLDDVSSYSQGIPLPGGVRKPSLKDRARLKELLRADFLRSEANLRTILSEATPEMRPAIRGAMRQATASYQQAIDALDGARQ